MPDRTLTVTAPPTETDAMAHEAPALIPRRTLFGNPVKASPEISPDGTMLAYLAPLHGVLNVWAGPIGAGDHRPVTASTTRGIPSFGWSADSRHILYVQDSDGDENYHFFSVGVDDGVTRDLTPFENIRARMIGHNKEFPDDLLLGINKDDPQVHDVYHLHLPTGELRMVAKNPGTIVGWLADPELKVRAAIAVHPEGGTELLVRRSEDAPWETKLAWSMEDNRSGPISFTRDGQGLVLIDSRDANALRVLKMDLESGATEIIAEDPAYDASNLMIHPDTYEIQMVGFTRDRNEWLVLDDSIAGDIAAIRALHHGDFWIISRDDADRIWVVMFIADNGPVSYYAYDRRDSTAHLLFDSRPDLRRYDLAPMEPVSFQARDGLTIHAYITFPVGARRQNLPMVLNVHGGPWVRDMWGYDAEAQWLANRGYICLQVNYRGSSGYGKEFLNAGNKEWGGKMHDDLVDAVEWAIAQGYAARDRVAIYGGSYGGYAALVGATFTPDLFRCAVDIVGPSNLLSFIETIPPYWKPNIQHFHKRVGNPETEAEFLRSRSPLFKVDNIRIPLLIAQGANDPRVKQSESEQIVEAMRSKGIEHQYMLFPDEGHGFGKPENRMRFYTAAERFLADHLGGRFEPEGDGN